MYLTTIVYVIRCTMYMRPCSVFHQKVFWRVNLEFGCVHFCWHVVLFWCFILLKKGAQYGHWRCRLDLWTYPTFNHVVLLGLRSHKFFFCWISKITFMRLREIKQNNIHDMLVGYILSRVCIRCCQFSRLPSLLSSLYVGLYVFNWPIQV